MNPWLIVPATVTYAVATIAAMHRLKTLKSRGALPPHLVEYFAPVIDGPIFHFSVGWQSLRGWQHQRMQDGRMLKLLVGREHAEIADGWLSAFVYAQRLAALSMIGTFILTLVLR